jgi:hypothetical protein
LRIEAGADTDEQRRIVGRADDVIEAVAEFAGLGGHARKLAVGMIDEDGKHEHQRRPAGGVGAAEREQGARCEAAGQAERGQVVGMDRRRRQRPDEDARQALVPG